MKTLPLLLFLIPTFAWSAPYNRYTPPSPKQVVEETPPPPVITPPVSPMPTNRYDITFEGDFLWWTATVTNLSYATKYEVIPVENVPPQPNSTTQVDKIYEHDWDWSAGVRAALGLNTTHDGWDLTTDWTYFSNSFNAEEKVHSPINTFFTEEANPIGTQLLSNAFSNFSVADSMATKIVAEGGFQMNQIDLELGRNFWISPRLKLRPYGGARAHFSHLDFRSRKTFEGNGNSTLVGFAEWNDRQKQKFWGVGILGGIDTSWNLYKALHIFGAGSFSLAYGPFKNTTTFKTIIRNANRSAILHQGDHKRLHDQIWTMQRTLDLSLGLRLENTWVNPQFQETFRMILDLGWEMHLYPGYNHLDQTASDRSNFSNNSTLSTPMAYYLPCRGNLTLSGLVFRGRFEF
ncbi:MAG: hypothetical protein KDK76_06175 [Chlamydiia bacterium]|nr:hypothetical protein [Chlamydiia bacterium]